MLIDFSQSVHYQGQPINEGAYPVIVRNVVHVVLTSAYKDEPLNEANSRECARLDAKLKDDQMSIELRLSERQFIMARVWLMMPPAVAVGMDDIFEGKTLEPSTNGQTPVEVSVE